MTHSKPDVQALIEHSIKLNTIAWRMAVALGEVPEGATKITADAGELLDRLLDRLSALSGETEAECNKADAKAELRGWKKGYTRAERDCRQFHDGRNLT